MSRARAAALAALAALALAGCATDPPPEDGWFEVAPGKWGNGVAYGRVEDMAARVPAVAEAVVIAYTGGNLQPPADERDIPGPTEPWVDAVAVLDEGRAAEIAAATGAEPASLPPVAPPVSPAVPNCDWVASDGLDAHFAGVDGWTVTAFDASPYGAFLCVERDVLVLFLWQA